MVTRSASRCDNSLNDAQLDRYARHIILKEIGGAGQARLLGSRIALIGAGGIGAPALQYLAAGGIGSVTIIDDDRVSLDNLHRQPLYGSPDVGAAKAAIASTAIARLNPDTKIAVQTVRIVRENAANLLAGHDLILDGSDNFATRLVVSDTATRLAVPLVSAAIGQFQLQVGTFRGWLPDAPCYRCFVGDAFDAEDCDTCSELGVLGPMAGIGGTFAALEAIRALTGFGADNLGKLHIFDGLKPAMRTIRIAKDPACQACGASARQSGDIL